MKKLEDIDLTNKTVILRCDLNVPMENGIITDDNRIVESIKTIKYLYNNANKVVILSHLGRVKSIDDKIKNTLKPVCNRLSDILNLNIRFCTYEEDVKKIINNNKIVMLENTRFFDLDNKKESNNDINLSKYFASLGDIFVNDAFGVLHRKAASVVGISKFLPSYLGFLVRKEIENLNIIRNNPKRPFAVILGGAKVSDKIGLISNLITKVDKLIIVGAMSFTFLKVKGINVGKSIIDIEQEEYVRDLLNKYEEKIILPVDVYTGEFDKNSQKILKDINDISSSDMALDIGPKTIKLISENINNFKTIFLNGPAGAFELPNFSYGTIKLFELLEKINANIIIGGGDSAYAAIKFGFKDSFTHISTGGGASLEYIEGKSLPGLKYFSE